MKRRVLIVHNHYQIPGGEDSVVKNEIELLRKHGYKVFFYHRDNNEIKQFTTLEKLGIPCCMFFNLKTYFDVKRIIKKEKIDLVHVHNTLNLIGPAVYYAAQSRKTPVVQTIHNFRLICPCGICYRDGKVCEECVENGMHQAVLHSCYRDSAIQTFVYVVCLKVHCLLGIYRKINYICLTDFNKNMLLKMKQIMPGRIYVKGNFVKAEPDFIDASEKKKQYVFVGRLEKLKGIEFLLKSWKSYQKRHDDVDLILLGDGPLDGWCESYIQKNDLHVRKMGRVDGDTVLRTLSESRALLFTSECYEGQPVSVVEAFSVGTPVVCADFGNAGTMVEEGRTGMKFRRGNEESFLEAMERMECHYGEMSDSCREEYWRKYEPEKNFRMLDQIYEDVLRRNG